MKLHTLVVCLALLGPLSYRQVAATVDDDAFFYVDEEDGGSGEGPDLDPLPAIDTSRFPDLHSDPHPDQEGSGHGPRDRDRPYSATYDLYDDDDLDYEVEYYEDKGAKDSPFDEEEVVEGSGSREGLILIDEEDEDPRINLEDPDFEEEVREEIVKVEHHPEVAAAPPATPPPPTLTDSGGGGSSGMDSNVQINTVPTDDRQVSMFAQPGILAAFIGGTVVGLLCAILLVMFIVYRMRKKDEGSYPLDEPKRMPLTSSYSPNDKEIYA